MDPKEDMSRLTPEAYQELLEKLNIKVTQANMHQALTHATYANEHHCDSNELLEFLGDSILNGTVVKALYQVAIEVKLTTSSPDAPTVSVKNVLDAFHLTKDEFMGANEGTLSIMKGKLVSTQTLKTIARNLGLGEYLFLSEGAEKQGLRDNDRILTNTLEAIIGAAFLSNSDFCKTNTVVDDIHEFIINLFKNYYK